MKQYIYRGDKLTDPTLKERSCTAVLAETGKCIRGGNGNILVRFDTGELVVVVGRRLKTIKSEL